MSIFTNYEKRRRVGKLNDMFDEIYNYFKDYNKFGIFNDYNDVQAIRIYINDLSFYKIRELEDKIDRMPYIRIVQKFQKVDVDDVAYYELKFTTDNMATVISESS